MRKPEDRRVLRTKERLRSTLLELLKEKPIEKITPTELCRRADVNRNTFYAHYRSPEALLYTIEETLFQRIYPPVEQDSEGSKEIPPLTVILQIFAQEQDLLQILCKENCAGRFHQWIFDLCHSTLLEAWRRAGLAVDTTWKEHIFLFSITGSVAVVTNWIRSGMKESPEELSEFIQKINRVGVEGFL